MFYFEVAPADRQYHGEKFLTYEHPEMLVVGQLVVVTLQAKAITGFIIKAVPRPAFKTKSISRTTNLIIPQPQLQLYRWIHEYYPYGLGATGSLFVPPALKTAKLPEQTTCAPTAIKPVEQPALTSEQSSALHQILDSSAQTHIVHGDTGTGKTRLYTELTQAIVSQSKSALILTPEISLTPQLIQRFEEVFSKVHVVHSRLTAAQRREIWRSVAQADGPQIVIGPRSALFLPLKNIGVIIIDEFHDGAYKQEQAPRYHALRVAARLARAHSAKLVLGSATPPIEDYFYATTKGAPVYRLTEIPTKNEVHRTTKIVNLSHESERSGHPLLSTTLIAAITDALARGEQALIFHNKRGSSRSVLCQSCGWFATCNRCNIPYTYHGDSHTFICHTCGKTESTPNNCPDCGSEQIIFKSPGTKAVAESLSKIFPKARIGRYDKDNSSEDSFTATHDSVQRGDVDILVGTQLLAKGHDLPNLSLVGVLLSETGLQFPDFTSEERSYQLLHQLAGRVGRGHRGGTVILQAYNEQQKTLRAAEHKNDGWMDFYSEQLAERKLFGFPPYCYLLKIEIAKKTEKTAQSAAEKIAKELTDNFQNVTVFGPAPRFIAKQADLWHWQIIIKSSTRSALISVISSLPKNCSYDLDPASLL